jgi:hypothetical protein
MEEGRVLLAYERLVARNLMLIGVMNGSPCAALA